MSTVVGGAHLSLDVSAGPQPYGHVVVSPVVLFSVLAHHVRRPKDKASVIGALLGRVEEEHAFVANCFTVPHTEDGQARTPIFCDGCAGSGRVAALSSALGPLAPLALLPALTALPRSRSTWKCCGA